MGRVWLDPGALRHQMVLETPAAVADGAGGETSLFVAVATVRARIAPMGPVEVSGTGFAAIRRLLAVTLRARADLKAGQRFRFGTRLLAIESVSDPDETGRFAECLCREDSR